MATQKAAARRRRHKGRAEHSFLLLPHYIIQSAEFRALSGNAVKLLVEMAGAYRGANNGDLSCAYSQFRSRGWRSAGTLAKAKSELLEGGFLMLTRQGGKHLCSLFAITWWPIDECMGKRLEVSPSLTASNLWKNEKASHHSDQSSHYSDQLAAGEAA